MPPAVAGYYAVLAVLLCSIYWTDDGHSTIEMAKLDSSYRYIFLLVLVKTLL